jgi:hypothetical protein
MFEVVLSLKSQTSVLQTRTFTGDALTEVTYRPIRPVQKSVGESQFPEGVTK